MQQYRPFIITTVFAGILYLINKLLFLLSDFAPSYADYTYSLETLYLFFLTCAIIVLFAVHKVHFKTPDNTGYVFMGATLMQMGLSYLMLRPILNSLASNAGIEKKNFFAIFILFLAIETVITIRLLNNKQ